MLARRNSVHPWRDGGEAPRLDSARRNTAGRLKPERHDHEIARHTRCAARRNRDCRNDTPGSVTAVARSDGCPAGKAGRHAICRVALRLLHGRRLWAQTLLQRELQEKGKEETRQLNADNAATFSLREATGMPVASAVHGFDCSVQSKENARLTCPFSLRVPRHSPDRAGQIHRRSRST